MYKCCPGNLPGQDSNHQPVYRNRSLLLELLQLNNILKNDTDGSVAQLADIENVKCCKTSCSTNMKQQMPWRKNLPVWVHKLVLVAVKSEQPLKCNFGMELSESPGNTPGVGLLVFVVERLNLLLLLLFAEFSWVRMFEELGSKLHQPLGVDGCHFPHVFLGCQHQLVVDHPVMNSRWSHSLSHIH